MKRTIFFALFLSLFFIVYAQNIDKSSYAEITYEDFMAWNETSADSGVPGRFKMYLNYDGPSSPGYNFKNGDENIILASDTELDYEPGQEVVVYFTALGPLAWDRSIDAIEVYDSSRIVSDPQIAADSRIVSSPPVSNRSGGEQPTLVPDSERPPASGSAQVLLPPESDRVIIEINRESNGNLRLSIESGGVPPPPNAYPPNPSASSRSNVSGASPSGAGSSTVVSVQIIPRLPVQNDRKIYKIQVGAFASKTRADQLFTALQNAGFAPAHEKFGNWNRVIISGVRASEVSGITRRLGSVGVKTVWLRE
jgi:cell division septation protein DedD